MRTLAAGSSHLLTMRTLACKGPLVTRPRRLIRCRDNVKIRLVEGSLSGTSGIGQDRYVHRTRYGPDRLFRRQFSDVAVESVDPEFPP